MKESTKEALAAMEEIGKHHRETEDFYVAHFPEEIAILHAAMPWEQPGTLTWLLQDCRNAAMRVANILGDKFADQRKRLSESAKRDFEQAMIGALLDCIKVNVECFIPQVKEDDFEG